MFQFRLFPRESYDYKEIFTQHIRELRSLGSRHQLLSTTLASLADVFAVESASVLLYEQASEAYVLKVQLGAAPAHYQISKDSPLIAWLTRHDEPLGLEAVTEGRFPKHCGSLVKNFIELKAAAMVPIRAEQELLGLVAIGAPRHHKHFRPHEKELLSLFGYETSTAIQNAYLYEEVVKQNAKLKELASLKNAFISNITHELATPLHNIIGLAQALSEGADGRVTAEQKTHLQMICDAGHQLLKIHQAILDLAQLENSPGELNIKKVNMRRMVVELMPWLKEATHSRQTSVFNDITEDVPGVYGDEEKIRQVFERLLENATYFTSGGEIRIGAIKHGDMLQVKIQDTGIGIDPHYHDSVFEAFRQVDGGYSRQHGGPGLGLAVAKKIIELHGGRIWLESKPGQGSRFYFTLPLRPASIRSLEMG